jgi:hypothetical protein
MYSSEVLLAAIDLVHGIAAAAGATTVFRM